VSRFKKGRDGQSSQRRGLRRWLARLLLVTFSFCVAAVLAELFFRHVLLEHKVPRTEADYAPKGHALAAHEVAEAILEQGLLPSTR
jgi:uncharacterized membrane protein YdbT with pleckstrin-like domain|tara:strand:- start:989 stop:1246 length:258 start_codon:yes stop_codon:yes gene_type:complete